MLKELKTVKKSLEDRQELMRRIALCEQIWLNQFEDNQKYLAKEAFNELRNYCKEKQLPFTFAVADIISFKDPDNFWFFYINSEKFYIIASYLINGNSQLEEVLPEKLKTAAEQKALKIVSEHIINNL